MFETINAMMIATELGISSMALTFSALRGNEVPPHFSSQGITTVYQVVDHDGQVMLFDLPYEAARWARQCHLPGVPERRPNSREWIQRFYSAG
jgi:hypothetical protein